jgi:hypothetical protein
VALNFKNANSDSIAVSGSFAVEKSFNPIGKQIIIDIGGVTKNFILNSKGISAKGSDSFKLKRTKKLATEAQFQLRLKNGSFSGELADEGLTNANSKNQRKSIGLSITVEDVKYSTTIKATYSGAKGKFGRAK